MVEGMEPCLSDIILAVVQALTCKDPVLLTQAVTV